MDGQQIKVNNQLNGPEDNQLTNGTDRKRKVTSKKMKMNYIGDNIDNL